MRRLLIDGRRLGERSHPRVLELDDVAARVGFEHAKAVEHQRRLGAAEPLHRLKRTVRRAAQTRVERERALVGGEGASAVALLRPALADVVLGIRVVRVALGDEREVGQRVGGAAVVEQDQAETVVRADVLRIGGQHALEDLLRGGVVSLLLPIQRRDGQVHLHVAPVGIRGGQIGEHGAGLCEVKLTHQADAAVVERDEIGGRRAHTIATPGGADNGNYERDSDAVGWMGIRVSTVARPPGERAPVDGPAHICTQREWSRAT
jgi:hypothetical protein